MTDKPLDSTEKIAVRDEVIAAETLRVVAGKLDDSDVAGEVADLEHQFSDERQFRAALGRSDVSQSELGRLVAETIRGERWIEKQIAPRLAVSDAEVRQYFQQHEAQFTQPLRIRARHIFLAAPEGSAPDVAEARDRQMLDIAARLGQGEDFGELAATVSEDEASKKNGGDLGFFAADRVPVEFFDAAAELQPTGPPRFLRSHLGFHALQSTDAHPARLLALAEAPPRSEHYYRRETAQCRGRAEVRTGALDLFCGAMRNCALAGLIAISRREGYEANHPKVCWDYRPRYYRPPHR